MSDRKRILELAGIPEADITKRLSEEMNQADWNSEVTKAQVPMVKALDKLKVSIKKNGISKKLIGAVESSWQTFYKSLMSLQTSITKTNQKLRREGGQVDEKTSDLQDWKSMKNELLRDLDAVSQKAGKFDFPRLAKQVITLSRHLTNLKPGTGG